MSINPDDILNLFLKEARGVWGNFVDRIRFEVVIRDSPVLMSLAYAGTPRSVSRTIYSAPDHMKLYVSQRALNLDDEGFQRILRHEALHIGIKPHNANFGQLAREVGAPLTENEAFTGKVYVMAKDRRNPGERYRLVKTVASLEEAREFARAYLDKHPNLRISVRG